jgi:hypothetical protein
MVARRGDEMTAGNGYVFAFAGEGGYQKQAI